MSGRLCVPVDLTNERLRLGLVTDERLGMLRSGLRLVLGCGPLGDSLFGIVRSLGRGACCLSRCIVGMRGFLACLSGVLRRGSGGVSSNICLRGGRCRGLGSMRASLMGCGGRCRSQMTCLFRFRCCRLRRMRSCVGFPDSMATLVEVSIGLNGRSGGIRLLRIGAGGKV